MQRVSTEISQQALEAKSTLIQCTLVPLIFHTLRFFIHFKFVKYNGIILRLNIHTPPKIAFILPLNFHTILLPLILEFTVT